MNKRKIFSLLLAAVLLLSGCSLARPETEADAQQHEDAMVGVLVTFEPLDLFDFERYFSDNADKIVSGGMVGEADAAEYQNCLFAEKNEAGRYVFPEVEGYVWLCTRETDGNNTSTVMQGDEAFDVTENRVATTDSGVKYAFAATIYQVPDDSGMARIYVNPLYQTKDGRVYALSGNGISTNTDGGAGSMTMTLHQTRSQTEGGKTTEQSFEAEIKYQMAAEPESVDIYWMSAEAGLIRQERYAPDDVPEQLDARGADFLVVVETGTDGSNRHTICDPETDGGQVCVLIPGESGILTMHYSEVIWE